MKKAKLYLNHPVYMGFAILDLSKILVYQFHYEYMKPKYDCSAKLLFTDSLRYEIETNNIYQDMLEDKEMLSSEYAQDHPLYSIRNKKVLGKMKDKTHGIPIQEFISLRPKMYSILYTEIKKSVTKKVRHDNYKTCLFYKKQTKASMHQIRSNGHEIYSIKLNNIALSLYNG